MVYKRL